MGCAASTAKRRRKQAVQGYTHLPKRKRPAYKTHSKETYERRARAANQRRLDMQARMSRRRKAA